METMTYLEGQPSVLVFARDVSVVDTLSEGLRVYEAWTITAVQPSATVPPQSSPADLIVVHVDDNATGRSLVDMIQRLRTEWAHTPIVAFGKCLQTRRMQGVCDAIDGILRAPAELSHWLKQTRRPALAD